MNIDDSGPAFPGYAMEADGDTCTITKLMPGMTLRDYFAAKAMAALIASNSATDIGGIIANVNAAYRYADALLAARQPQPKETT